MNPDTRKRFELLLNKTGTASQEVLHQLKDEPPEALGSLLVRNFGCNKERILDILAEVYRVPAVDPTVEMVEAEAMGDLTAERCMHCLAAPLRAEGGNVVVAFADPENLAAVDELQAALGRPVQLRVALSTDIQRFLLQSPDLQSVDQLVKEALNDGEEAESPPVRTTSQSEATKPVVQLLDRMIADAITRKAQHMYFIPFENNQTRVRLCVGRQIVETHRYAEHLHANIVNRLRVLCDLVGKDKRVPQNGAFMKVVKGTKHRLDVMIVPAPSGDAVTIFFDQDMALPGGEGVPATCNQCGEGLSEKWAFCPFCGTKIDKK